MKGVSGVSGAGDIFNNIVYYLEPTSKTPSYIAQIAQKSVPYLNIIKPLPNSVFQIDYTIHKDLQ